ncbi:hypothetical protein SCB71_17100 [Herbiconiux sp. KACC 21604]|uniref:hypothetical protein n=1 Tax=unclassified Herbiconiux TaxID=2618217 RepID=UPI001493050A|nr:hypothetical protein [Herbiconiux sp. SALV-R1]QJU54804.1 hypothetical protein HL652_15055 [Herbiconiux sp. SALV-R1]WPO85919.1 hypothetical protein SCB71_17100 [Herbiconiux sp. KACC 21604]
MTSPDSYSGADAPLEANPRAGAPAPLSRRELREQRAAAEAAVTAVEADAPLTRRRLRELRQQEIDELEIAAVGSAPLEPGVELPLEPVAVEEATDPVHPAPLHIATPQISKAQIAPAQVPEAPVAKAELVEPEHSTPKVPERQTSPSSVADFDIAALLVASPSAESSDGSPSVGAGREVATRRALRAASPAPRDRRGARSAAPSRPARSSKPPRASGSRRNWAKGALTGVAMAFVLGITAVTAIPTTVSASPVDANVVNLSLNANANAATQQLITSNTASTEVVDRDGYAVSDVGELQAAGYSTAQLLVGRSLAQELVDAMDSGKLVGSVPDHMKEIRWIAQGVTVPDCGVDYRVLEIIAIAVRNFDQVGVSDINRKCTGQIEGAGTSSSHYIDGGGHAVDFYLLDNKSLNGYDAGTLKLISLLDPVMPVGARVGQASCRASAGVKVNLTNWTEFDDSCTHMHVDVPVNDAPLLLNADTLGSGR